MQVLLPHFQANDVVKQLEERVREHAAWIETNGTAQLRAYTEFVAARQRLGESKGGPAALATAPSGVDGDNPVAAANGAAAATAAAQPEVQLDAFQGRKPQSLTVLGDLDTQAVVDDLETRVRDVVGLHLPCVRVVSWALLPLVPCVRRTLCASC